jgi:DNA-binding HxlR family transcriptional regulator
LHDATEFATIKCVLGREYETQDCSAARTLEMVGERWSLLIIRDAVFGRMTRFSEFQRSLGLARNVLAARLEQFVLDGLMEKRPIAEGLSHHVYVLTEKGRDLQATVQALMAWGDKWAALPEGPPVGLRHADCGGKVEQKSLCGKCGEFVHDNGVVARRRRPHLAKARGLAHAAMTTGHRRS